MKELNSFLAENGIFMLTIILFFLGIFGMISCGNYMKKADVYEYNAGCGDLLFSVSGSRKAGGGRFL